MAFLYGTRARIRVTFTDPSSGAPTDPTQVRLTVRIGSLVNVYTYGGGAQIVREGAGKYYYELLCSMVGPVNYRWDSLAVGQEAAEESSFSVVTGVT